MKLSIYFGGMGYHCDKPLLYYARSMAAECGYKEYITIDYKISVKNVRGNKDAMTKAFEEAFEQAVEKLSKVEWEKYDDIVFISKSIGTAVAAAYIEKNEDIFVNKFIKNIYMTPLPETFIYKTMEGIAFTGTNDPWADTHVIAEKCMERHIELQVTEGVNHSLECDDVRRNLKIIGEVMERIRTYL